MSQSLETGTGVYDVLDDFCRSHGFDNFSLLAMCMPRKFDLSKNAYVTFTCYPDEWVNRYLANQYYTSDPVLAHCLAYVAPIDWSCVASARRLSSESKRVMDEARDHGLRSGISFSIRGSHGELGMLSITCRDEYSADVSARIRNVMPMAQLLLCQLFENLADSLYTPGAQAVETPLSGRERECLRWIAEGKTAWEIGNILGIAERTVVFHTNNAVKKLDAANRTHAVARALHLSLISL